jgi:hypothetical protein
MKNVKYSLDDQDSLSLGDALTILQSDIASACSWLYIATENQRIADFLFYKVKCHIYWSLLFAIQILK